MVRNLFAPTALDVFDVEATRGAQKTGPRPAGTRMPVDEMGNRLTRHGRIARQSKRRKSRRNGHFSRITGALDALLQQIMDADGLEAYADYHDRAMTAYLIGSGRSHLLPDQTSTSRPKWWIDANPQDDARHISLPVWSDEAADRKHYFRASDDWTRLYRLINPKGAFPNTAHYHQRAMEAYLYATSRLARPPTWWRDDPPLASTGSVPAPPPSPPGPAGRSGVATAETV